MNPHNHDHIPEEVCAECNPNEKKEDVYWNDDVPTGNVSSTTTWFRVTPQFKDFYKLVKSKHKILGVVLSEDELNIGFIIS